MSWPRYAPERPLPARAYLPGRSGRPPARARGADAAGDWQGAFRWGLDLYNHGFPWEAHEVWEALWREAAHGSAVREMLHALIQCAAAVVHARAGRPAGQRRLAARALARLDAVRAAAGPRCLDIDVAGLAQGVAAFALAGCAGDWPRIALAPATAPAAGAEAPAFAGKMRP